MYIKKKNTKKKKKKKKQNTKQNGVLMGDTQSRIFIGKLVHRITQRTKYFRYFGKCASLTSTYQKYAFMSKNNQTSG